MQANEREDLLRTLETRFEENMHRHEGIAWGDVEARLEADPSALEALSAMEASGGEPDVIGWDAESGRYTFFDCSTESPVGRRSVCYDREALEARKKHKPESSAVEMADAMGIELLTEEQYRELQTLGEFDTKTSSLHYSSATYYEPQLHAISGRTRSLLLNGLPSTPASRIAVCALISHTLAALATAPHE